MLGRCTIFYGHGRPIAIAVFINTLGLNHVSTSGSGSGSNPRSIFDADTDVETDTDFDTDVEGGVVLNRGRVN